MKTRKPFERLEYERTIKDRFRASCPGLACSVCRAVQINHKRDCCRLRLSILSKSLSESAALSWMARLAGLSRSIANGFITNKVRTIAVLIQPKIAYEVQLRDRYRKSKMQAWFRERHDLENALENIVASVPKTDVHSSDSTPPRRSSHRPGCTRSFQGIFMKNNPASITAWTSAATLTIVLVVY